MQRSVVGAPVEAKEEVVVEELHLRQKRRLGDQSRIIVPQIASSSFADFSSFCPAFVTELHLKDRSKLHNRHFS